jgi:ATP adenylyltransferase
MNRLWAPWRNGYVKDERRKKGCIFCRQKKYLVFSGRHCACMLNIYPYNNGHLMVYPLRHVRELEKLSDIELLELMRCVNKATIILRRTLRPQGYNIGMNIASCSGAGIAGHIHLHIVPRWQGDTNFMPVLASTKVMPQSLEELLRQLKDAYAKAD